MKANEPVSNIEQANTPSATETPVSPQLIASKKITNGFLVGLVIFLFGATGFFAYKYFQLKQQFEETLPTPTSEITTISPSPLPSPQPTTDPTADWKTYTSSTL